MPFATFYLAIVAVAFYGNLGAALISVAVSTVVGSYFFADSLHAFAAGQLPDRVAVALFVVSSTLLALMTDRLAAMRRRLLAAADESRQQAAQIRQERTRLQQIISSVPGVVWEAWGEPDSSRQRIDYVSDHVTEMLGYTPEEWTSTPNFWLQIVAPEDREAAGARRRSRRMPPASEGENEFRWVSEGRPHHLGARAVHGDQGRATAGRSACAA